MFAKINIENEQIDEMLIKIIGKVFPVKSVPHDTPEEKAQHPLPKLVFTDNRYEAKYYKDQGSQVFFTLHSNHQVVPKEYEILDCRDMNVKLIRTLTSIVKECRAG